MPTDNQGSSYTYKSSETNSQGKNYCARESGSNAANPSSSNQNGSSGYVNSNVSTPSYTGNDQAWFVGHNTADSSYNYTTSQERSSKK